MILLSRIFGNQHMVTNFANSLGNDIQVISITETSKHYTIFFYLTVKVVKKSTLEGLKQIPLGGLSHNQYDELHVIGLNINLASRIINVQVVTPYGISTCTPKYIKDRQIHYWVYDTPSIS